MNLSFLTVVYENCGDCVSWSGLQCGNTAGFDDFLHGMVLRRLDDTESADELKNCLKGLALSGLGEQSLSAFLGLKFLEERQWAAGEALAEVFLEAQHGVVFPWNMERDKRNALGSLPGADIVGFIGDGDKCRFALGEVKTSSQQSHPPQIVCGYRGRCSRWK